MCRVVTCWERADLLALVCGVQLLVGQFPIVILCQVWYLIVSIPDLCTLAYFLLPILNDRMLNQKTIEQITCCIKWA